MDKSKVIYRSTKKDDKGYYLRVKIVEENTVALLTEGSLSMLIVKDISDGSLFAISPITFEKNFKIETSITEETTKDTEIEDFIVALQEFLKSVK